MVLGLAVVAFSLPTRQAAVPPEWLVALGAIGGLAFTAVLLGIAWSAGEWSTSLLALGCVSMAVGSGAHV
ncbi:MAG: hypothetical protein ABIQ47_02025, partial [Tepidiformaceae bacterium]